MAVHKRGYKRYDGPLTGRWARLLVLPRFAWSDLMGERKITVIFIGALFWPIACLAFIYLANHRELLLGLDREFDQFLQIDGTFFVTFMSVQATFAVLLATFAGPSLIAPDLSNGALSLYFGRPFSRTEYVASRMLVLAGVLSPVTWIPGAALFVTQASFAGWAWTVQNWTLGAGIVAGFALWVVFVSLVALTSSAYVRWRVVSGGLILGTFFVLAGAAQIARMVLSADWPAALNPALAVNQIWRAMLGAEALPGPDALQCLLTMAVMSILLLYVLGRKLRPVEVVN
jgi:ABC-2 type transport system permease protein